MNELTAADRCDRCGAAAMVRVNIHGTHLDFCRHHFLKNEEALMNQGGEIALDIRHVLEAPLGASV